MRLQVSHIKLLCCFIFKLAQIIDARNVFHDRKSDTHTVDQLKEIRHNLQKTLLLNMGLKPEEIKSNEQYGELLEKLPHFVPDFMKRLYDKYRFSLYSFSVEIGDKLRYLGPIEMIHCQNLRNLQIWVSLGIQKLIFKSSIRSKTTDPVAKELRINKQLFPKLLHDNPKNFTNSYYIVMMIFDDHFRLFKEKLVTFQSFNKQGWISIDISDCLNSTVFYIKTLIFWKKGKNLFKRIRSPLKIKITNQLYLYYANIVTFYKNKSPSYKGPIIPDSDNVHKSRFRRDLSHYSTGQEDDCQRHSLIVTFKEVGWSKWIIAPEYYNAYYCKGNCPYPLSDNFNATNHAIIQLLVHGLKDFSIPKPCCVPYHLHPETLLYSDSDGGAVMRVFKDMAVSSCSCR